MPELVSNKSSTAARLRKVVQEVQKDDDDTVQGATSPTQGQTKPNISYSDDEYCNSDEDDTDLIPTHKDRRRSKQARKTRSRVQYVGWKALFQQPNESLGKTRPSSGNIRAKQNTVPKMLSGKRGRTYMKKTAANDSTESYTFQPKINPLSRKLAAGQGKLLKRMEAAALSHQKNIERKRGQKEYDEKVDKKICPKCGATQSYDEVISKKMKCQNCLVRYTHRCTWHNVADEFLKRQEGGLKSRNDKLHTGRREWDHPFRPNAKKEMYDPGTGKFVTVNTSKVYWHNVEHGFMERLETDIERRESKQAVLEQQFADEVDLRCSFRPSVNNGQYQSSRACEGSFMERMERDFEQRERKIEEMEYDEELEAAKGSVLRGPPLADPELMIRRGKGSGLAAPPSTIQEILYG